MAQHFITTNKKTYIWHDYRHRTPSEKPSEAIYNEAPNGDIWLDLGESGSNTLKKLTEEDMKKFVAKIYKRRYWTTSQISYSDKGGAVPRVVGVQTRMD